MYSIELSFVACRLPAVNIPSLFLLRTMIPPCDPSILENNPQFKRLYENLSANLLNPDGSTRAHSADPTREAVAEVRRGRVLRTTRNHNNNRVEMPG